MVDPRQLMLGEFEQRLQKGYYHKNPLFIPFMSKEKQVHVSVDVSVRAVRHDRCLRWLSSHTTELRVHNHQPSSKHNFCRLGVPLPFMHPYEASCGGLLDAGAAALLGACSGLQVLHLAGMGASAGLDPPTFG